MTARAESCPAWQRVRKVPGEGPAAPLAGNGREAELEQVRGLLARAQRGTGGVLLVEGEPASGKSLLLRNAVEEAAERGFCLAVGAADPLGTAIPFFTLRSALGGQVAGTGGPDGARGLPDAATSLRQMRAQLERRAAAAPVLVCLDDLHWESPAALAALRTLPRDLSEYPVAWLLAWSSTPGDAGERPPGIAAGDGAARVTLSPLGNDVVTVMLTQAFGAPSGPHLAELASGAAGSAALVTELIGGLRDEGAVRVDGGLAELVSDRLPGRIHRVAERWRYRLGEQARHLVMTAAVVNHEFWLEDVAEMLGKTPATLLPAAEEAVRARLLTAAEHGFTFRHELLRRALSEMVPEPAARALRRQYGEILLARGGPADQAAEYLLRAVQPADRLSLASLDKAARRTRCSSPGTAADLALRALELTPPADPGALSRAVTAAEALVTAGRLGEAVKIARDLLARPLPAAAEARTRCALSLALCDGGLVRDAAEQARLALALPRLPDDLRDQALAAHWQALTGLGAPLLGREAARVLAVPGGHGGRAVTAAMVARASVNWCAGRLGDSLDLLRDAARSRSLTPRGAWSVQPSLVLAAALVDLGELGEADAVLRAADGRTPPRTSASAALSLLRARVHLAAGRPGDAAATASEGLAIAEDSGAHAYAAVARAVLSAVELRRGDVTAAAEHLARRPVTGPQFADIYARAESVMAQVRVTEARDGPSAVLGDIRRLCAGFSAGSGPLAGDPGLAAWLARAALAAGDGELAARIGRRARCLADAYPAFPALGAAAAHAHGIAVGDEDRLAEAIAVHQDPWARASAAEDLGVLHAREGRADQAVKYLEEALGGYRDVRAERDQARVRGRLRRLGIRRRHWGPGTARPLSGWGSLTETEQAVARLVAEGLNNKQVGARMFISVHTVAHYLRQAFRKLGISSRVELTRIVIEQAGA
jgi:DNA-binding CsgD family transcriptional regulator